MKIVFFLGFLFISLFAKEVNLPNELNAWKSLSYVGAAKNVGELSTALIQLNNASFVGLVNTPKMKYEKTPKNEGGIVSYGGMFQVEIKESGLYRIALGNASWIDFLKGDQFVKSVAHKGGPKDSGIKKMVDYVLEAGIYTLQLSAAGDSTTALLITKIK